LVFSRLAHFWRLTFAPRLRSSEVSRALNAQAAEADKTPEANCNHCASKRRDARKLAEAMGTPFYIVKDGKIVDLNPKPKRRRKSA
jgi:hypothetical protein